MSQKNRQGNEGFTLIEMLISMAILIFISFGIYQATTETFRLRAILSTEGDFYTGVRLAMDIVQKDVSLIYSPTLMAPDTKETSTSPSTTSAFASIPNSNAQDAERDRDRDRDREIQNIVSSDLGQTTKFWLGAKDATGIRGSRFIGTESSMSFIAASHLRIYRDSPESEFAKVSFELIQDDSRDAIPSSMVLIKKENSDAFSDDQTNDQAFTHSYKLLRGISQFKITYYKRDGNTWKTSSSWDNDKEDNKSSFPDMIEIALTVKGPSNLLFEGVYKFRPEAPLSGLNPSF